MLWYGMAWHGMVCMYIDTYIDIDMTIPQKWRWKYFGHGHQEPEYWWVISGKWQSWWVLSQGSGEYCLDPRAPRAGTGHGFGHRDGSSWLCAGTAWPVLDQSNWRWWCPPINKELGDSGGCLGIILMCILYHCSFLCCFLIPNQTFDVLCE